MRKTQVHTFQSAVHALFPNFPAFVMPHVVNSFSSAALLMRSLDDVGHNSSTSANVVRSMLVVLL